MSLTSYSHPLLIGVFIKHVTSINVLLIFNEYPDNKKLLN